MNAPGNAPKWFVALIVLALLVLPSVPLRDAAQESFLNQPRNNYALTKVGLNREQSAAQVGKGDRAASARVNATYASLPLSFESNEGQTASNVKFISRSANKTLFLTPSEAVLTLRDRHNRALPERRSISRELLEEDAAPVESTTSVLRMRLVGSNSSAKVSGLDELPGKSNYFIGNDPKRWRTGVANYTKVKYEQVYKGVDLVYYGNQRQLEYDLIVAPGASPGKIVLEFKGAERMRVQGDGNLLLTVGGREISQYKPAAYQEINGIRRAVGARYVLRGKNRVGFAVESYQSDKPLIIDPVIAYSTYMGGSSDDEAFGIAVDSSGNAYVTGYTFSSDFPMAAPSPGDVFVTKLNASGTAVFYSTLIGGTIGEIANAVAVDAAGNVYVTGETSSGDFPTLGPIQGYGGAPSDAFVFKLNAVGSLAYSTFLGGSRFDSGQGIAVDESGSAYVTGETQSTNFPTPNGVQTTYGGYLRDAFVSKLNTAGDDLVYSTYLGGLGTDGGLGIALDSQENVYITGFTSSADFPTTNPLQASFTGKTAFKTTDGGGNWNHINTGLPAHLDLQAMAIDPATPATLYGATTEGLFKTTNGGSDWSLILSPPSAPNMKVVAIDPSNPSILFAGSVGISRSTDGGDTWSNPVDFDVTNTLAIHPQTTSKIYAGTNRGLYITGDSGLSWNLVRSTMQLSFRCLVLVPAMPSTMYAGTSNNLLKSTDGGLNWAIVPSAYGNHSFGSIAIDPLNPSTIYAGNQGVGVIKSTDSGNTWTKIVDGITDPSVSALAIDPQNTSIVYAATSLGVFKSTNGGTHWDAFNNGLTSFPTSALGIDPVTTANVYAGSFHAADAFVTKLDSTGARVYSTYLGGSNAEAGYAVAADSAGNAYVTGSTVSLNFPIGNALQSSLNGAFGDAFITKLNSSGNDMVYSTYLGGSGGDFGVGIAVDQDGNAWIAGDTFSSDFPTAGSFQPARGGGDAFVSKLNDAGSALLISTYLGGTLTPDNSGFDEAHAIAIDPTGGVCVAGSSGSTDFSTTPGAFKRNLAPFDFLDGWVARFSDFCLEPFNKAFTAAGGTGSVNLTATAALPWSATSNDSWIAVNDPGPGSGDGTVSYAVGPNSAPSNRSGTITIANLTFTVLQGAAFNDVPPGTLFYDEIGRLSAHGITVGCGGGSFCPNDVVLREQMAAFIIRALGDTNPTTPASQRFDDVPPSNPFYSFIEQMAVRQITSGCGVNNYCPSQPVLRDQMAAFIIRALGEFTPPAPASQRFNDVPPSNPFYNFIDRMAVLNVTFGCSASPPLYCPSDSVTRAQMAAFLVRAFNL